MLLPLLTDVIVKIQADVIAYLLIMADVIAIIGRCYCQLCGDVKPNYLTFAASVMADVIAWWQMEWPLQGDLADVIAMGQILL